MRHWSKGFFCLRLGGLILSPSVSKRGRILCLFITTTFPAAAAFVYFHFVS
jgi:hypothetical protein